jgi:hypothetical protein
MITIKITWKRFLIFIALAISLTCIYLNERNWFFDQKLKRLANPLLREVMEVGVLWDPKS